VRNVTEDRLRPRVGRFPEIQEDKIRATLAKADCSLKFVLKYIGPTCPVCWLFIHRSGTKK
jgi:hypothetical protein